MNLCGGVGAHDLLSSDYRTFVDHYKSPPKVDDLGLYRPSDSACFVVDDRAPNGGGQTFDADLNSWPSWFQAGFAAIDRR